MAILRTEEDLKKKQVGTNKTLGFPQTMSATPGMVPTRDDLNAAADRESKENIVQTQELGKAMQAATKAPPQQATTAPPPAFQAFQNILQAQSPEQQALQAAATRGVTEGLEGGPTLTGDLARADLERALKTQRQETRESLVRAYGTGTGQIQPAMTSLGKEKALTRTRGMAEIRAGEQTESMAMLDRALQMVGQNRTEAMNLANMAVQTAENALDREIQKYGIDEQGKIAVLLQQNDQTFQALMQERGHLNEQEIINLSGNIEAGLLQMGFDQETATLLSKQWHDKAMAEINNEFISGENALDRELQKYTVDEQIAANAALQANEQAYQALMQERGYLNERDIIQLTNELQAQLMQAGFDQEKAMQLAGFKHDQLMAKNQQQFAAEQAKLNRMHEIELQTGRLNWESRENLLARDFTANQNTLDRELQKYTVDEQARIQEALQASDQEFQTAFQQQGFVNEQAMVELQNAFQTRLTQMGFAHEDAMQMTDILQDRWRIQGEQELIRTQAELDRQWKTGERISSQAFDSNLATLQMQHEDLQNRLDRQLQTDLQAGALSMEAQVLAQELQIAEMQIESSENMMTVQLAQEDAQFAAQLGLDQQQVNNQYEIATGQLEQMADELQLDRDVFDASMDTADVQDAMSMLSIAMELEIPDEGMRPFIERVFGVMASDMGWSEDDIDSAVDSVFPEGEEGEGGGAFGANNIDRVLAGEIPPNALETSDWLNMTNEEIEQLNLPTITSNNTFLRPGDFTESGLRADIIKEIDEKDSSTVMDYSAGEGNGSIVMFNNEPYRIIRFESKIKWSNLIRTQTQRIGRLYGVPLRGGDEVMLNDTGWIKL